MTMSNPQTPRNQATSGQMPDVQSERREAQRRRLAQPEGAQPGRLDFSDIQPDGFWQQSRIVG